MDGLHHLPQTNGNAHVLKLCPSRERIGGKRQSEPARISDVVVGLLGAGSSEVGTGDRRIARNVDAEDGVAGVAGNSVQSGCADARDLPGTAVGLVEPGAGELQPLDRRPPERRSGDVHTHVDFGAGRDSGRCFLRHGGRCGIGAGRGVRHHQRVDLEAQGFGERRVELRQLDVEFVNDVRLVVGVEAAAVDPGDQLLCHFITRR